MEHRGSTSGIAITDKSGNRDAKLKIINFAISWKLKGFSFSLTPLKHKIAVNFKHLFRAVVYSENSFNQVKYNFWKFHIIYE